MSEVIIERKKELISGQEFDCFTMVSDCFYKPSDGTNDGYVQMDVRTFKYNENESEPLLLIVEVANEIDDKNGDYLPFVLDKEDLDELKEKYPDYTIWMKKVEAITCYQEWLDLHGGVIADYEREY